MAAPVLQVTGLNPVQAGFFFGCCVHATGFDNSVVLVDLVKTVL